MKLRTIIKEFIHNKSYVIDEMGKLIDTGAYHDKWVKENFSQYKDNLDEMYSFAMRFGIIFIRKMKNELDINYRLNMPKRKSFETLYDEVMKDKNIKTIIVSICKGANIYRFEEKKYDYEQFLEQIERL